MVVNAFKTYAATQYPTQATYENDFKANTYLTATINQVQTAPGNTGFVSSSTVPIPSAVPYYA